MQWETQFPVSIQTGHQSEWRLGTESQTVQNWQLNESNLVLSLLMHIYIEIMWVFSKKIIIIIKKCGLEFLCLLHLFFHDSVYYSTLCGLQLIQSALDTLRFRQVVWSVRSISNEISFCLDFWYSSHCNSQILIHSDKNNHCAFNTVRFFLR